MPPVRSFHLSLYLSLAIMLSGIGIAGGDLLPELPFITLFSLLLVGVAYYREGRWELSLKAANTVGLVLAAFLGLWLLFRAVGPKTTLAETLPWPANLLPYCGPVLMILIPAKMLRPKHVGDYWTMQALSLLGMALACAMASDGIFFLVFALYALAFVWNLTTFHLFRELGPTRAARPMYGSRWRGLKPALGWTLLAASAAIPLFWLTPRTNKQWELGLNSRGRAITGISDGPVDLNSSGALTVNQERAFSFFAADPSGTPYLDMPADQRFRALYMHNYEGGRWVRNQSSFQSADRAQSPLGMPRDPRERMPDFGPGTVHLTYTLIPRLMRTPPLADPVAWQTGQFAPASSRFRDGTYRSWVHRHDGSLDGAFDLDTGSPEYMQAWIAPIQPGEAPTMRLQPAKIEYLTRTPRNLNSLKQYTDQLVDRLVAAGSLPEAVLTEVDRDTRARNPRFHLQIGRAIEQHLAASGEFTYTLEQTRHDSALDPVEDFVLHTKAGYCQRFATALVLMLRTQGVPSQLVMGYRGCESRGDGHYDVTEAHAHAWVEVLVPASGEGLAPVWAIAPSLGQPTAGSVRWLSVFGGAAAASAIQLPPNWQPMRWVTLDPTPGGAVEEASKNDSLLTQARERWEELWKSLLLAYNRDSREKALGTFQDWLVDGPGLWWLGGIAATLVAGGMLRRQRRRFHSRAIDHQPDYLRRLTTILTRAGYPWELGLTAREYALEVTMPMESTASTRDVAYVPLQVVAAYYQERYAEIPLTVVERAKLLASIDRVQVALRT